MRQVLRTSHYSPRTEAVYVAWVQRFVRFHGQKVMSALLLLYRDVLRRPLSDLGSVRRARTPARLPIVLTRAEVHRVLEELGGTYRLIGMLLYGAARAPKTG